ncbi:DASS family sodium-coupled anion symporter [Rhodococcus sp. ACS1]|uniref:SLC13 family permease n=1 Tax=Rhodococcus sp. ACS1 TaxID=2028570 RepID=UPI00211B9C8B|nr:DASS family sodium-coupled anion symporter [Rhodococcus sp. ACS1]
MRTLAPATEQPPKLAGEERFDFIRGRLGLIAALPLLIGILVLPIDMPNSQQAMLAVLTVVVLLWITEPVPIPVTALIGIALLVVLGVGTPQEVYGSFGSATVFLVIGAFILARAMTVHGLDRRFALKVLSFPGIGNSTYRTAAAFGVVACILSMFVSSSATAAMLLPIGIGVVKTIGDLIQEQNPGIRTNRTKFSCLLMLSIAYGASIGSVLTPITGIANVIGRGTIERMTGYKVELFDWISMSAPYLLVMGAVMWVALILVNRPEVKHIRGGQDYFRAHYADLGPMNRGERNVLVIFLVTVVLWVLPSLVTTFGVTSPIVTAFTDHLNEGSVVVLTAGLLFFLPRGNGSGESTLTWSEAAKIDWGTVLLVGAGLTIGTMMNATGLAETLGTTIARATGVQSSWVLALIAIVMGLVISETTSNTASVGIVVPIIIPIALAIGVDPIIPAMAGVFGANAGAMLPVSTPPNAIVYGSGYVPMIKMISTGIFIDIICIPLIFGAVVGIGSLIALHV